MLGAHIDHRYRRGIGGTLETDWPETCHIPFATVIAGYQSLSQVADEIKPTNAVTSLLLGSAFVLRKVRLV